MTQEKLFFTLTLIGLLILLAMRVRKDFDLYFKDCIMEHGEETKDENGKRTWSLTIFRFIEINYKEK